MTTVMIYGHSDDLVIAEVDGVHDDEYCAYDKSYVEVSTGDVFSVVYDAEGIWRFNPEEITGQLTVQRVDPGHSDDQNDYSETLLLEGTIDWVDVWPHYPPTEDDIQSRIEEEELLSSLNVDQLSRIYRIAKER